MMRMKLLVDKKSGKVLFAEANKDVVDFIFSFLSLPVGGMAKLLSKEAMSSIGSIGTLCQNFKEMNDDYMVKGCKNFILNPKIEHALDLLYLESSNLSYSSSRPMLYGCSECMVYSDVIGTACSDCHKLIFHPIRYAGPRAYNGDNDSWDIHEGFVHGSIGANYIIMDNLSVFPMSRISSLALMKKLEVKDLDGLEEKSVEVGDKECLALMQTAFVSKAVLTDVFLEK